MLIWKMILWKSNNSLLGWESKAEIAPKKSASAWNSFPDNTVTPDLRQIFSDQLNEQLSEDKNIRKILREQANEDKEIEKIKTS